MSYTIKIEHFEGPFDLLLFFIERDELDIYDIPIARITDDFLAYIRDLESMNIDMASEFILVAATLMRIKARMLIPRRELDEMGNEIDPRAELVERLIEYKKFKVVLEDLRKFEEARSQRIARGNAAKELHEIATRALVDVELESLSQYRLFRAFNRVMARFEDRASRPVHTVVRFKFTVEQEKEALVTSLEDSGQVDFQSVFDQCEDRIHAIVIFLAMLELLNQQEISLVQGDGINNFWLAKKEKSDEEE